MKKQLIAIASLLGGIVVSFAISPAAAELSFVFTESLTGGVNVVGSGSGFADRDPSQSSLDWDIQDFETDFLDNSISVGFKPAAAVSGFLKNVTTDTTVAITSFRINRNSATEDDLDWGTVSVINFNLGEEYLFELTATFDPAVVPFSILIPGSHRDVGRTLEPNPDANGHGPIADEIWGITTVNVVPEPASLGLLFACLASLGATRLLKR